MKKIIISLSFLFIGSILFSQNIKTDYDIHGNANTDQQKVIPELPPISDMGNEWESIGPFGGDALDIAFDPANVDKTFVAAGYPYMRNNEDEPWHIIENLLSMSPSGIHCFESTDSGYIFAAGNYTYGKVFRSEDGGETWQQKTLPVSNGVLNIAVAPSNQQIIYVTMNSNLGATQNKVIIKSENGGDSWTSIDMTAWLPVGWACVDITVDPDNSETIFALGSESFSNAKALASFDGGLSWNDVSSGLPFGRPFNEVTIANGIVYISGGQLFGGQYMGIYKSENYGSSWTEFSANFPNQVVNDFIVNPDNANKMYAATEGDGIYYTPNGGITWLSETGGAGNNGTARKILFKPDDPSVIYGGFLSLGVCVSTDNGNSYNASSVGIASLALNDIEIDPNPNNPQMILASFEAENSGGCYLFTPESGEWEVVNALPGTRFSAVSIGIDGTLYAWSNGPTSIAPEGVYKSTDGGITWENKGPDLGTVFETQIFTMALSETDPDLIFIGGNNFGANGWASMIYRSTNGGDEWENVYMGPENDGFKYVFIDPTSSDQVIYASYKTETDHAGYIKSTDGGDNWTDINNGIPAVMKWAGAIICDPASPETLYAGAGGYGGIQGTIYKSEDGGASWNGLNISLGNYNKVTDLLISPDNPEVIYAATSQDGVYITEDGLNFEASNEGLPASYVTGFSRIFEYIDGDLGFYCSTFTNSAFYTVVYDPNAIGIAQNMNSDSKINIFPNPSDGYIQIDPTSFSSNTLKITICNVNGAIVLSETINKNSKFALDLQLTGGMYFVTLMDGNKTSTQKLIVK
jgi:photosystem II stability/assembly factor-like uncharacterized protein